MWRVYRAQFGGGFCVFSFYNNFISGFRALKTIDALALKIQFTGPSMSISTRNLALGVSSINSTSFRGGSFSVSPQNNASDFQVQNKQLYWNMKCACCSRSFYCAFYKTTYNSQFSPCFLFPLSCNHPNKLMSISLTDRKPR